MALQTIQVTIPAGASMSSGVDCSAYDRLARIIAPADWTAAALTFQLSPDGTNWNNLYHTDPKTFASYEVIVPTVTPGSVIALPVGMGGKLAWVRIRSGPHTAQVKQSADRVFQ